MTEAVLIELVPHAPHWAAAAARDVVRVRRALGDACHAVHHVGSTSVPGIRACPVLDLLAEVRDLSALHAARLRLLAHGFAAQVPPERTQCATYHVIDLLTGRHRVELHCYEAGHAEAEQVVAFFAFLRVHPEVAQAYEALKREGRVRYAADLAAYDAAKRAWVAGLAQQARAHWHARRDDLPVREIA